MINFKNIKILKTSVSVVSSNELLLYIDKAIKLNNKVKITYAHFHSLNNSADSEEVSRCYENFDIIHADGIGVFIASRFLYGHNGLKDRLTGSDFYPLLLNSAIENSWKVFFFGDVDSTLTKIEQKYKELRIAGLQNGFEYDNSELIERVNASTSDILIVGIGGPNQEKWITENSTLINAKVIIAVGEGIKVFAGVKHRGPKIFQKIGLEWMVRLFYNPELWKRYFFGIPLFCFRVLKQKVSQ